MTSKAALIHAMGRVPGLSRVLRWAASRYPEGSVVPIRSGLAQGMRWRRSHRYVNGYWLGQYELEIQAAIARLLPPGGRFLDLGANAGFFSLVAARRVGAAGSVVALDPDRANYQNMIDLRELNGLPGWTVLCEAVGESAGVRRFVTGGEGDSTGHFARDGEAAGSFEVPATTVDAIVEAHGRPNLIKMDIEGAELEALAGAARTLREHRPVWLIELHGPEIAERAREILWSSGHRFETPAGERVPDGAELGHYVVAVPV